MLQLRIELFCSRKISSPANRATASEVRNEADDHQVLRIFIVTPAVSFPDVVGTAVRGCKHAMKEAPETVRMDMDARCSRA